MSQQRRRSSHRASSGEARGPSVWIAAALSLFLLGIALLWAADLLPALSAEVMAGVALSGLAVFFFLTPGVQRRLGRWLDRRWLERWRRRR